MAHRRRSGPTEGLEAFGTSRKEAQERYREFAREKVHVEYTLEDQIVGQIFLGSTAFIEKMQELVDSEERSTEHPLAQRDAGRPSLDAIRSAVTETLDVTEEELRTKRGDLSRIVYAKLGWWEGLRPLREIAADLGLRSLGHVSNMIRRCIEEASAIRSCAGSSMTVSRSAAPQRHRYPSTT